MATRKRRKGRQIKKIRLKGSQFLLVFGSVTILTLAFSLYLSHTPSISSPPAFEETRAPYSEILNKINELDSIIYKLLYENGVSEKDIVIFSVKPRQRLGKDWDFSELLIRPPSSHLARQVDKNLRKTLSQLQPSVTYKINEMPEGGLDYHISIQGFYTHRLRMVSKGFLETDYAGLPKIAIIMDDLGYDLKVLNTITQLDIPVTLSVLPLASYTRSIVEEAKRRHLELILHLPMEPNNYPRTNPGPGALLTSMSDGEIKRTLRSHIAKIPGIKGVNNHMGSYFTTRSDKMTVVMEEIRKRGLYYIDSRTTTQTVAFELAKKIGVPTANRNVFLDNTLSQGAMAVQMKRLFGLARQSGSAIGICHPHEKTLLFLRSYNDQLRTQVEVVPVSELLE